MRRGRGRASARRTRRAPSGPRAASARRRGTAGRRRRRRRAAIAPASSISASVDRRAAEDVGRNQSSARPVAAIAPPTRVQPGQRRDRRERARHAERPVPVDAEPAGRAAGVHRVARSASSPRRGSSPTRRRSRRRPGSRPRPSAAAASAPSSPTTDPGRDRRRDLRRRARRPRRASPHRGNGWPSTRLVAARRSAAARRRPRSRGTSASPPRPPARGARARAPRAARPAPSPGARRGRELGLLGGRAGVLPDDRRVGSARPSASTATSVGPWPSIADRDDLADADAGRARGPPGAIAPHHASGSCSARPVAGSASVA